MAQVHRTQACRLCTGGKALPGKGQKDHAWVSDSLTEGNLSELCLSRLIQSFLQNVQRNVGAFLAEPLWNGNAAAVLQRKKPPTLVKGPKRASACVPSASSRRGIQKGILEYGQ